jgi:hypothetical protein
MNSLLLLLTLTLSAPLAALTPPSETDNPAARIKAAIDSDWVAKPGDFGSVVVASPSYAMPFNQGCVIHELAFLSVNGQPSLGQMMSTDRYFVFAAGDACANVNPALFFSIEPGNDTVALLDFSKRLKTGPRPAKDKISAVDYVRIAPCFAPDAMANTRIVRAHSWREKANGRDDRYQVTLHCKHVDDAGEIIALGVRDQDAISWVFKAWGEISVDVPTPKQMDKK